VGVTPSTARVVAVVVTYRAGQDLTGCVESLDAAGGLDHIVIVDNGGEVLTEERSGLSVVRPTHNVGFGAGANAGFVVAESMRAEVVVLLNDDLRVDEGWLDPLVAVLADEEDVGAVQPMLVFADDPPTRVNSLGVDVSGDGAGVDIGIGDPISSIDSGTRDIEAFTGGAVAFRPEFLVDTGGFDERYFLYYEDVDLARRGARLGWRYRCVPTSVVVHRKGASTVALGDRLVYLRERNRLWSAFRNETARIIAGAVWLSIRRVRHSPRGVHAKALAVGVGGGLKRLAERRRR
jgi:N-acetylglucosaminyl-diphospho-decaprenol L-rhamnosyltransferase